MPELGHVVLGEAAGRERFRSLGKEITLSPSPRCWTLVQAERLCTGRLVRLGRHGVPGKVIAPTDNTPSRLRFGPSSSHVPDRCPGGRTLHRRNWDDCDISSGASPAIRPVAGSPGLGAPEVREPNRLSEGDSGSRGGRRRQDGPPGSPPVGHPCALASSGGRLSGGVPVTADSSVTPQGSSSGASGDGPSRRRGSPASREDDSARPTVPPSRAARRERSWPTWLSLHLPSPTAPVLPPGPPGRAC